MADARFFKNTQRSGSSPIDVRGDILRVLAITVMDKVKSGRALPDASLKKIVERMAILFPEAKRMQTSLFSEPEALDCLAFVLRQLAVDEALAHPEKYQDLFANVNSQLPIDYLRQLDTPLHPCALAAAARALNITITRSIKTPEEDLRARSILNQTECTSAFNVTIQVQEDRYFPCVRNQSYFSAVGQLPINLPTPVLPVSVGTIGDVQTKIAASNAAVWEKYQEYCTRLISTADANGLNARELALLYSKTEFLPDESSMYLFAQLEKQHQKAIARSGHVENLERQNVKKLIKALAGGLSTGCINEDMLFDAMEQPSYRRTSSVAS